MKGKCSHQYSWGKKKAKWCFSELQCRKSGAEDGIYISFASELFCVTHTNVGGIREEQKLGF